MIKTMERTITKKKTIQSKYAPQVEKTNASAMKSARKGKAEEGGAIGRKIA